MPRFFFDLLDGGLIEPDEEGIELPDLKAAVDEAHMRLAEMPSPPDPHSARSSAVIQVRDGPDSAIVSVLSPLQQPFDGHATEALGATRH